MEILFVKIFLILQISYSGASLVSQLSHSVKEPKYYHLKSSTGYLINRLGYSYETHKVTTSDGYKLTMFRIPPQNLTSSAISGKRVIFLQHGLIGSSTDTLINKYAYQNLPTVLSSSGFDVWLGNFRGNPYSDSHTTLNYEDEKFWEFSWDQMAQIDLPAMMDYVLNYTRCKKLAYIGHSMGTTTIFAMNSYIPQFQEKISVIVAMAPIASLVKEMPRTKEEIKIMTQQFKDITRKLGIEGRLPSVTRKYTGVNQVLCDGPSEDLFCPLVNRSRMGTSINHVNQSRVPIIADYFAAQTSIYTIIQYAQVDKGFHMYDYGIEKNQIIYQQNEPPKYFPERTTVPVIIISSPSDKSSTPQAVNYLRNLLPNIIQEGYGIKPPNDYSHSDFIWAADAYIYIYNPLISLLKTFTSN